MAEEGSRYFYPVSYQFCYALSETVQKLKEVSQLITLTKKTIEIHIRLRIRPPQTKLNLSQNNPLHMPPPIPPILPTKNARLRNPRLIRHPSRLQDRRVLHPLHELTNVVLLELRPQKFNG